MGNRITVFTPTHNRAHLLGRLYESLKRQTNKDFIWMIIDDGSKDGTGKLVSEWKGENLIQVDYHYKENGGMHTAHNVAYQLINTELNVCIDSDDIMPDDAIEKIIHIWDENKTDAHAGIIGLDADFHGNIIGTSAPEGLTSCTLGEFYNKHKATGDKKLVYRSDVMKEIEPYPVFEGEKLVPLTYKYLLADLKYQMIVTNEIFCQVEYQPEGSTNTVFRQYFESPRGFTEARKLTMKHSPFYIARFRNAIHYVSSSIIIRNKYFFRDSPRKMLTLFAVPFGILLTVYLKYRLR